VNGDAVADESDRVAWCAALSYCEGLTLAGSDDWRLPNVRELESLIDYGRTEMASWIVYGTPDSSMTRTITSGTDGEQSADVTLCPRAA
jgi:hypothetical protein